MTKRICPSCLVSELIWDSDENAEDAGYSESGIITFYHCNGCGAQIEVFMPMNEEEKQ